MTLRDRAARDRRRRRRALEAGRGRAAPRCPRCASCRPIRPSRCSRARRGARRRPRRCTTPSRRPAARSWSRRPSSRGSCRSGCASRPRGSGLALDQAAAKALVAQVGERQQRLLRELEKLALEARARRSSAADAGRAHRRSNSAPRTPPSAAPSRSPTRSSAADAREATLAYLRLRRQGERIAGLAYLMASRLREALAVALRLQAGERPPRSSAACGCRSRAAERFIADVARSDPERLRGALGMLADLELDTRGGAPLRRRRARAVSGAATRTRSRCGRSRAGSPLSAASAELPATSGC